MKYNKKRIVFLILLIIWMIVIFAFSHQSSEGSSKASGGTLEVILNILPSFRKLQEIEKQELIECLQPLIRKLAHFSIYTLGGIISMLFVNTYNIKENKKILYASLIGIIYSVSDEIHQMFIPRKKWRNRGRNNRFFRGCNRCLHSFVSYKNN